MECHNCGDEFSSGGLSRHWNFGSRCDYPELTEHQRDIFKGILMSDGYIDNSHNKPRFSIDMIAKNYLYYLYKKMPNIFLEPRKVDGGRGSVQQVYRLRSRAMPCFEEFSSWYDSGKKVWPNFTINSTIFKHWYCGDGYLDTTKQRPNISIGMANESDNTDKVKSMFDKSSIPEPKFHLRDDEQYSGDRNCVAYFDVDKTEEIFQILESPPPYFEYKWPDKNN